MRTFLPLLLLSLASCSKETRVVNTYPKTLPFRLQGINDLVIERNPFRGTGSAQAEVLNLQVLYGFGTVRRVQLSMAPLVGINAAFSVTGGIPDFYSQVVITDSVKAPVGNYEMRITAQPDSGTAQTLKFNLKLTGDTSCVNYFAGKTYDVSTNCPQSGTRYKGARLDRIAPGNDTLLLTNFRPDGVSLKLLFDCNRLTISIPTQTVNNITFNGRGSIELFGAQPPASPYLETSETNANGSSQNCSYYLEML